MEVKWYYAKGGDRHGPVTEEQIRQLAVSGQLQPSDLVWRKGMPEWAKAGSVQGLFSPQANEPDLPPPLTPSESPPLNQPISHNGPANPPRPVIETDQVRQATSYPVFKSVLIVVSYLTICLSPIGLCLVWTTSQWTRQRKLIWTALLPSYLVLVTGSMGLLSEVEHTDQHTPSYRTNAASERGIATSERSSALRDSISKKSSLATRTETVSEHAAKELGTLQGMGAAFYDKLAFAEVQDGEPIEGVKLSEELCPSGRRTYRSVLYDQITDTMDETLREQMSSLGMPWQRNDRVFERERTCEYAITPGEPKNVYSLEDRQMVPLLRLGALPGQQWEWRIAPYDQNVGFRCKYVRAVRFEGTECVLIVSEMHGGPLDITGLRYERWYAKGIGLVKEDEYARTDRMTLMSSRYLVLQQ